MIRSFVHALLIVASVLLAPPAASAQGDPLGELPDVVAQAGRDLTGLHRILNSPATPFDPVADEDGRRSFDRFVLGLRKALEKNTSLLAEIGRKRGKWAPDVRDLVLRGYLMRVQGPALPADLAEVLRFRTVAGDAEGMKQLGAWLQAKTRVMGLGFRRVPAARGFEITLGKGRKTVGIVTHVDVDDARADRWKYPPFEGKSAARRVWGRGAHGGKTALVALLHALRAVRDSGVPLKRKAVLFVGTDGQGALQGVRAYQAKRRLPKTTFVAGGSFPLSLGEKGLAKLVVRSVAGDEPDAATQGWRVLSLKAGAPDGKVPVEATAVLDPRDLPSRRALGAARRNLTLMRGKHPEIDAAIETDGPHIAVTFRGRAGRAWEPDKARNAAADLVVYLADYLGLFPDHRGRLVRFLNAYVGHETDGKSLGVYVTHERMTPTTVSIQSLSDDAASLDIRWPIGHSTKDVLAIARAKAREFTGAAGGTLTLTSSASDPVLVEPETPFVKVLLAAYEDVARRQHPPRTLDFPTYARFVPGSIGFGAAPMGTSPDRDATDESIGVEELELASKIYATALVRLLTR